MASGEAFALSACDWESGVSGELVHNLNLSPTWVGRDAPIGAVIGQADVRYNLPNEAGTRVICTNFGAAGPTLTARVDNTQPLFTGPLPPVNGEDLTGRVIETGVDGIGIHVRLDDPYHGAGGSPINAWTYIKWMSVPWQGYADHDPGPTGIQLSNLRAFITLIKTGPIAPGPQSFNGVQLFNGTYSDVGTVMRYHLHGTVTAAQCTLKADAVNPDPVELGTHEVKDFGTPVTSPKRSLSRSGSTTVKATRLAAPRPTSGSTEPMGRPRSTSTRAYSACPAARVLPALASRCCKPTASPRSGLKKTLL